MSVDDGGKRAGQIRKRIDDIEFAGLDEGGNSRPVLCSSVMPGEERVLAIEGNLPDILPISGKKSRSITAGMHFMVGMSDVTTASGAADRKSSLSSMNPE